MSWRRPSTTSVSSPLRTMTTSSNSGFCAGSLQPGGASMRATDTESVPVVAAPTNSSMRFPSSRGITFPLRSFTFALLPPRASGARTHRTRLAFLLRRRRHHQRALGARLQCTGRILGTRMIDALERVQEGLRDEVQVPKCQIALIQLPLGEDEVD